MLYVRGSIRGVSKNNIRISTPLWVVTSVAVIQDFRPIMFRNIYVIIQKCLISCYEHLGDRANSFVIGLTDVSPAVEAPRLWDYDVCGQWPGEVATGATVHLR